MKRFLFQILAGILGIWLAVKLLPQVEFTGSGGALVLVGIIFGFLNSFIKPLVSLITLPLKLLTLGLFTILLDMGFVWLLDILFPELIIPGIFSLFLTTIILYGCSLIFSILETKFSN